MRLHSIQIRVLTHNAAVFSAALIALVYGGATFAAPANIHNLRMWPAPDHTRLVFDTSAPVQHEILKLANPPRLVIDIRNARLPKSFVPPPTDGAVVGGVRTASHGDDVRVVIDLKTDIVPRAFTLEPYQQYGHRLVVDLLDTKAAPMQPELPLQPPKRASPDLLVAIDAGHGGEDPGAMGRNRTREKDVVLQIARELNRLLNDTQGMRAFLVRDGDYYISLRGRIEKARKQDPDVFISIHADAIPGRRQVQGASVYALSERGASREANYLAARENAADLIGGVSFNDKDDVLSRVLVDMTQTGTINSSLALGNDLLAALKQAGPVHSAHVGQAGFFVLRSPYIPSVLIESAFISNPAEERKLRDPRSQRRMAAAIRDGLKRAAPRLLARRMPGGSEPAPPAAPLTTTVTEPASVGARRHVVRRGDTLDGIAREYGVAVEALRFSNRLGEKRLRVGDVLEIPAAGDT